MADSSLLQAALVGYQYELDRVRQAIRDIEEQLGGSNGASAVPAKTGRRTMSADARARIAAAQRKRWAASKKAGASEATKTKKRRHMSAAGRRAIAEATRKRWAAYRAQQAK
jgi:hypothetical protein